MTGLVLMENAGRGTADVLCRLAEDESGGRLGRVAVCCGKGNNAGDGFVIARHLDLARPRRSRAHLGRSGGTDGRCRREFRHPASMRGVPIELFGNRHDAARLAQQLVGVDWIVDALLGTGARGEPRPPLDAVIDQLNAAAAKRLAVDLPSGLDCDTGAAALHTIRAAETCTFVAMKARLRDSRRASSTLAGSTCSISAAPRRLVEEIWWAERSENLLPLRLGQGPFQFLDLPLQLVDPMAKLIDLGLWRRGGSRLRTGPAECRPSRRGSVVARRRRNRVGSSRTGAGRGGAQAGPLERRRHTQDDFGPQRLIATDQTPAPGGRPA